MSESMLLNWTLARMRGEIKAELEERLRHIEESCNSHYTNHMTGVVRGMVWALTGNDPGGAGSLQAAADIIARKDDTCESTAEHRKRVLDTILKGDIPMPHPPLDLDNLFTYHPPKGDQAERYVKIRDAGKALAQTILDCTPPGPDQTSAIRKVREACFTGNAAIACGE